MKGKGRVSDQKAAHIHPTSTLTGPTFVRTFHMSEEDGTADCSHTIVFGARWSPEFPVLAPQNAGHEREGFPSLGHNSWSEAAFSNAPQSGNVSAAATTLRWSYSCLGHMSWPERAFLNVLTIDNDTTVELDTALELLLPPTCSDTRKHSPTHSNKQRVNSKFNNVLELLLPRTHTVVRGSILQRA